MMRQLLALVPTTAIFRPKGPARSADALLVLFYWRDTSMDPLTMGLITGGSNLLGSLFSSFTSAGNTQAQIAAQQQMQGQSEQFNAGQAQIQRDYQTQMSNTAYQRASADMKSAGLNPMMMANGSMNASTPSGSSASIGTPSVPLSQNKGALSGVGDAVSKGVDAAVNAKTFQKMTDEIANLKATNERIGAETEATKAAIPGIASDSSRKGLALPAARVGAREAEGAEQWGDENLRTAGKFKYGASTVGDIVGPIVSSATGVGRIGQAFSDIASGSQKRAMERGNFVGKYGMPLDEYMKQ